MPDRPPQVPRGRHHVRFGLPAAAVAGFVLAGCSYFPSHEEVFHPVAVTIGQPEVAGTDTVWRVDGRSWTLRSPRRDLLPDVVDGLENTRREWRRYFPDDPPSVDVRLLVLDADQVRQRREREGERGEGPRPVSGPLPGDSAGPDSARGRREGGPERFGRTDSGAVRLMVLTSKDSRNTSVAFGSQNASRVANAWLTKAIRQWRRSSGDTARAAGPTSDWAEDAIGALIAPSPRNSMMLSALAGKPESLIPLATLFTTHRPPGDGRGFAGAGEAREDGVRRDGDDFPTDGGMGAGMREGRAGRGRRGPAVDLPPAVRFSAEAYAVADYIADKEGPVFVGHLIEMTSRGESVEDALADARVLPKSLTALETGFKAWLGAHAGQPGARDREGMAPYRVAGGQS